MAALRVTCGQAYLWEANLPSTENNTRADVAAGLRSELSEGHPEPGTHSVFQLVGSPCHAAGISVDETTAQPDVPCFAVKISLSQRKLPSPLLFLSLLSSPVH